MKDQDVYFTEVSQAMGTLESYLKIHKLTLFVRCEGDEAMLAILKYSGGAIAGLGSGETVPEAISSALRDHRSQPSKLLGFSQQKGKRP